MPDADRGQPLLVAIDSVLDEPAATPDLRHHVRL